jgi:hypothetical protein
MNSKRAIFRVQLDIAAKHRIEALCDRRGMTQIAVMSRLITWFTGQPDAIQTSILGQLTPENAAVLARHLLENIARPSKPQ